MLDVFISYGLLACNCLCGFCFCAFIFGLSNAFNLLVYFLCLFFSFFYFKVYIFLAIFLVFMR